MTSSNKQEQKKRSEKCFRQNYPRSWCRSVRRFLLPNCRCLCSFCRWFSTWIKATRATSGACMCNDRNAISSISECLGPKPKHHFGNAMKCNSHSGYLFIPLYFRSFRATCITCTLMMQPGCFRKWPLDCVCLVSHAILTRDIKYVNRKRKTKMVAKR